MGKRVRIKGNKPVIKKTKKVQPNMVGLFIIHVKLCSNISAEITLKKPNFPLILQLLELRSLKKFGNPLIAVKRDRNRRLIPLF